LKLLRDFQVQRGREVVLGDGGLGGSAAEQFRLLLEEPIPVIDIDESKHALEARDKGLDPPQDRGIPVRNEEHLRRRRDAACGVEITFDRTVHYENKIVSIL